MLRPWTILIVLLTTGCQRYWVCDEPPRSETSKLPARLSETGLYSDISAGELAPGVASYTPQFELWSDGAEKQRWILLPEGQPIDTADMDEWRFPQGTKVWKQFARGGTRIETRLLEKVGADDADWLAMAYAWEPGAADAIAVPLGALDAGGTEHDVPAASECQACHAGRRSFVLGFSAIQLAQGAAAGDIDLSVLGERGLITNAASNQLRVPGNSVESGALGYLHANCSHCHNAAHPERSGARCFDPKSDLDFSLAVEGLDAVASTPTYRTAIGEAVTRGDADGSKLIELVSSRGMFRQMPPLATEKVDTRAVANLRRWIEEL